eukprot:Phypoly_transcript_02195.p1 GENE.Phypoly_transcript_02195~~Phypoly_transcript_02195.p1  ORF type:complete len:777 (+),score=57.21 Phypoly_transcript_02195:553-2883(+)
MQPNTSKFLNGELQFSIGFRMSPFYAIAKNVTLSTSISAKGNFAIPPVYNSLLASQFRFAHVSGYVACNNVSDKWHCNWGCTSRFYVGATYCFEIVNNTYNFSLENVVVPSSADPRVTFGSDPLDYYFYLSDQDANQDGVRTETLVLETNLVLDSGLNYSLQFCEFNASIRSDNVGSSLVNIEASFEPWELIAPRVTINNNHSVTVVVISEKYRNRQVKYVRLLHLYGNYTCFGNGSEHRWGCFDTSNTINETFYVSLISGNSHIIPAGRDYIPQTKGYSLLGSHIDDDSITYEANFTMGISLELTAGAPVTNLLNFSIYAIFEDNTLCDSQASFAIYTGGTNAWCGPCKSGFSGSGYPNSCIEVNQCETYSCANGAICANSKGSYSCSCPAGWKGKPDIGCFSCGDGICNSTTNENCATCPEDCFAATCGICGDSVCDASVGENCFSCFVDCGPCATSSAKCPGSPAECSGHGICSASLCTCNNGFSGPACNQVLQPITVVKNDSSPNVTLTPSSSPDIQFRFSIFEIREVDAAQNFVTSEILTNRTFNATHDYVINAMPPTYLLSTVLPNKARVQVSIFVFTENTEFIFVNETLQFSANSIKYEIAILAWPFRSATNKLWLMTSQNAPNISNSNRCGVPILGTDSSGNLRFSQIQINSTILYGRFLEFAAVDGRKKSLELKALEQTESELVVAIIVPFFFDVAIIDPDFAILFEMEQNNDGPCNPKRSRKTPEHLVIGIVVGVFGAAFLIGIGMCVLRRRRFTKLRKAIELGNK